MCLFYQTKHLLPNQHFRLIGLLRKKSLSEEKLDDIKIKANILAAFVKGAVDQQKSTGAQATPSSTSSPKKHTKEEL